MDAGSRTKQMLRVALAMLAFGCAEAADDGTSSQSNASACAPGEAYECACLDGTVSTQACLPSGDALGPCDCGVPVGTGGTVANTGGFVSTPPTGGTGAGTSSTGGTGSGGVPLDTTGGSGGVSAGGAGGMPLGGSGGALTGGFGGTPFGGAGGTTIGGAGGTPLGGSGGAPIGGAGGTVGGAGGTVGGAGGSGVLDGACCSDGDCICRGDVPTTLTTADGPYNTTDYSLRGVGCIYYPTDAEPPFSAVAISDGYLGTGGCGTAQTSGWGPFYASHGIVAMIIETGSGDQPRTRGAKLLEGIAGFKAENENPSSPLYGQLAGRYGTSGFSMGGGGTTYAAQDDPTLLTSVGLMAWTPTGTGVTVPTLFTCGSSDGLATCSGHTIPAYNAMPSTTPKMRVTVSSGHAGQPSSGRGMQGAWGLAFQKLYLDGDERWRSVLLSGNNDATNIQ